MIEIQLIGILFALGILYLTFMKTKNKLFTAKESAFWAIVWLIFMIIVIMPSSIDFLIFDIIHFARRLDFFIVVGFLFLITMNFYTYIIVRNSQNKIEEVVRNVAFRDQQRREKKKKQ